MEGGAGYDDVALALDGLPFQTRRKVSLQQSASDDPYGRALSGCDDRAQGRSTSESRERRKGRGGGGVAPGIGAMVCLSPWD